MSSDNAPEQVCISYENGETWCYTINRTASAPSRAPAIPEETLAQLRDVVAKATTYRAAAIQVDCDLLRDLLAWYEGG